MTLISTRRLGALALTAAVLVSACSSAATADPNATTGPTLSGDIRIDGSSTVYPVTEAIAEEFQGEHPDVRVTVAFSGTGGGFKKFCAGETDANDASRPIKSSEQDELCKPAGIEPVELKVAIDGLTVVVNHDNTAVSCMTTAELNQLWDQGSTVKTWSEIRPEWPSEQIALFGPGADSGTFDYFTEAINGESQRSRSDFTQSEDDNALVFGIAGDPNGLGYFGYSYYFENQDKLKAVEIDGGNGCVAPTEETINNGTYAPLSRPLFIYSAVSTLERPEVAEFFRYYLDIVGDIVGEVGYIALPDDQLQAGKDALEAAIK